MTTEATAGLGIRHPDCPLAGWTGDFMKRFEGSVFAADMGNGETLPLTLASVSVGGAAAPDGGRAPFSLLFRSGRRDFHLPQGIWPLCHEEFGRVGVFLVPIGPDGSGMCYEAVFN